MSELLAQSSEQLSFYAAHFETVNGLVTILNMPFLSFEFPVFHQ